MPKPSNLPGILGALVEQNGGVNLLASSLKTQPQNIRRWALNLAPQPSYQSMLLQRMCKTYSVEEMWYFDGKRYIASTPFGWIGFNGPFKTGEFVVGDLEEIPNIREIVFQHPLRADYRLCLRDWKWGSFHKDKPSEVGSFNGSCDALVRLS